jgi:hypothetical protein
MLKSGAIVQLGGEVVCHMTVLPGQSKKKTPNLSAAHLYCAGAIAGFSCLFLSQL